MHAKASETPEAFLLLLCAANRAAAKKKKIKVRSIRFWVVWAKNLHIFVASVGWRVCALLMCICDESQPSGNVTGVHRAFSIAR